ncbi:RhuM family protein [Pararobbsia alpina]|nr:RhuM family protein [Pararobbsia alpina]
MNEWESRLDAFLQFNEREILTHAGKVSAQVAERLALERYAEFDYRRRTAERLAADAEDVDALEQIERQLEKKSEERKK